MREIAMRLKKLCNVPCNRGFTSCQAWSAPRLRTFVPDLVATQLQRREARVEAERVRQRRCARLPKHPKTPEKHPKTP